MHARVTKYFSPVGPIAAVLIGHALLPWNALAQPHGRIPEPSDSGTTRTVVDEQQRDTRGGQVGIEQGFLIAGGRYLPPPYFVTVEGEQVFVNDIDLGAADRLAWGGPGGRGFGGRRGGGPRFRMAAEPQLDRTTIAQANVEQALLNGDLIIRFDDGSTHMTRDTYTVLETLLEPQQNEERLRDLANTGRRRVTLGQWASLLDNFEASDALQQRFGEMQALREKPRKLAVNNSPVKGNAMYALTVLGMLLTVSAFGVVLSYHPKRGQRWREINEHPEAVRLVCVCAALVAALSVFDLMLTLLFRNSAGFWELNPLGGSMLAETWWLTAFKLGATAVSVSILLGLRKYRGAQMAAWWTCLALTLLTARWVAFNSMLIV